MKLYILCILCSVFGFSQNPVHNYKLGIYNSGSFVSNIRGEVPYEIYLPLTWDYNNKKKYPVVIALHGQGTNELSFVEAISNNRMNKWIEQSYLDPFILIAIRGGKNLETMQWTSPENIQMLTSKERGELQYFLQHVFNGDVDNLSIIGHSRGASGALNLAFNYPEIYKKIVSSAFVSDYNLAHLKTSLNKNLIRLKNSDLKINLIIGEKDQYVLKYHRKGTYRIHNYLIEHNISHQFDILKDKNHFLKVIFKDDIALNVLKFCVSRD